MALRRNYIQVRFIITFLLSRYPYSPTIVCLRTMLQLLDVGFSQSTSLKQCAYILAPYFTVVTSLVGKVVITLWTHLLTNTVKLSLYWVPCTRCSLRSFAKAERLWWRDFIGDICVQECLINACAVEWQLCLAWSFKIKRPNSFNKGYGLGKNFIFSFSA